MSSQVVLAEDTYMVRDHPTHVAVKARHPPRQRLQWHPCTSHSAIRRLLDPPQVLRRNHNCAAAGLHEARVLRLLASGAPPHPKTLPRLRACFCAWGHVCLVLDRHYAPLLDLLPESCSLDPARRICHIRRVARQLVGALARLHRRGLAHADVKPGNVLLREPLPRALASDHVPVCLVDMGAAVAQGADPAAMLGSDAQTLYYRAPEVAAGKGVGPSADLWSLGCVLAEMALLRPLFPASTPADLPRLWRRALVPGTDGGDAGDTPLSFATRVGAAEEGPAPPGSPARAAWSLEPPLVVELGRLDRSLAALVRGLLESDPKHRLTAEQALRHPFLAEEGDGEGGGGGEDARAGRASSAASLREAGRRAVAEAAERAGPAAAVAESSSRGPAGTVRRGTSFHDHLARMRAEKREQEYLGRIQARARERAGAGTGAGGTPGPVRPRVSHGAADEAGAGAGAAGAVGAAASSASAGAAAPGASEEAATTRTVGSGGRGGVREQQGGTPGGKGARSRKREWGEKEGSGDEEERDGAERRGRKGGRDSGREKRSRQKPQAWWMAGTGEG